MRHRVKFLATALAALALAALAWPTGRSATAQTATAEQSLTVVFTSATLPTNVVNIVEKAGGRVVTTIPEVGVLQARGPASLITTLSAQAEVQAVAPSLRTQVAPVRRAAVPSELTGANTTAAAFYNAFQWDIKQVTNDGASFKLPGGTGSRRTVVGVIDSGINTQHPDLARNLLGGRNFVPDGPNGTVVATDIEDKMGHGSHVAGAIAGNGLILGVGPDLGLHAYRVFGATGSGEQPFLVAAIVAAANDGVDVINMSLGNPMAVTGGTWTAPDGTVYRFKEVADFVAMRRAIQYATTKGVTVVASAGNETTNITNPTSVTALYNALYGEQGYQFNGATFQTPTTIAGVVTVSATGPDKSLASYSNFGSGAIQVSAPGGDFQRYPAMTPTPWYFDMTFSASWASNGTDPYNFPAGCTTQCYTVKAGTSMSAPKVSAVAALIADQAKARGQRLTPAQAVTKLQQTATDLGQPGYDHSFGHGFANAYTALGGR